MSNKAKKYIEEEIIRILREAGETLRKYGANDSSYYRWKAKYAGVDSQELLRLRQLESENNRLKKIVADQVLAIQILKNIN